MAEPIFDLALESLREKGKSDAQALADLAAAGKADGTYLIAHEAEIPTWRQRAFNTAETPVGKPYKWKGQIYKLWQQHDATQQPDWSPNLAVSLWDICHTTDPKQAKAYTTPQGSRGLWQVDECCMHDGHIWKNLVANHAYGPREAPSGWDDLGPAAEVQA